MISCVHGIEVTSDLQFFRHFRAYFVDIHLFTGREWIHGKPPAFSRLRLGFLFWGGIKLAFKTTQHPTTVILDRTVHIYDPDPGP
jgi:hypothetical protein